MARTRLANPMPRPRSDQRFDQRAAKALLGDLTGRVTPAQVDLAIAALADRWETAEAAEGLAAFFDKRKPGWAQ